MKVRNMENNIVVIINGKPRSGKDTFCNYIVKECEEMLENVYINENVTLDD